MDRGTRAEIDMNELERRVLSIARKEQAANSNVSSGSFGAITTTYPARQIQFALKLIS